MKYPGLKLIAALAIAVLAGTGVYFWKTAPARAMMCCDNPELAWLETEFKVSDRDMDKVAKLHEAYLAQCADLCARIDATNTLVRQQLAADGTVTPNVEKLLGDAAGLRVECQKNMLGYFVEVSQSMPPEQGRRYLAWMQERIFSMSHEPVEQPETVAHHGH